MRVDRRLGLALLLITSACSSAPKTETPPPAGPSIDESSVEIHFVRGHNNHRLFVSMRGDAAVAQSFFEHQMLSESMIDHDRYMGFLAQACDFLKVPHGAATEASPCRTPFTVTVRMGTETRAASGCVGSDEGALSHLVRDGEFLLHQGSGMRIK